MMKFSIFFERKIRVAAYDMLTIGLSMEFDSAVTPSLDQAFETVKAQVNVWIQTEQDRLPNKAVPRPKLEKQI